jgi:hypothetical protein
MATTEAMRGGIGLDACSEQSREQPYLQRKATEAFQKAAFFRRDDVLVVLSGS